MMTSLTLNNTDCGWTEFDQIDNQLHIRPRKKDKAIHYKSFTSPFLDEIVVDAKNSYSSTFDIDLFPEASMFHIGLSAKKLNSVSSRLNELEDLIALQSFAGDDNVIPTISEAVFIEQKNQIKKLQLLLDKKSTPRIFAVLSSLGLFLSCFTFVFTLIWGAFILSPIHFIVFILGFSLMLLMSILAIKAK